jgi:predicted DNA-binding ribbon-helix-helix protein
MRKKIPGSSPPNREFPDVDTATSARKAKPDHSHMPTSLPESQLVLCRPAWAHFEMENGFWHALQDICDAESLSREAFIERARNQHPGNPIGSAVSIEIIAYLRNRAGHPPIVCEPRNCSLHEAPSGHPPSSDC